MDPLRGLGGLDPKRFAERTGAIRPADWNDKAFAADWNDEAFVLTMIRHDCGNAAAAALCNASAALQSDWEVVLVATGLDPAAIEYAAYELRADKSFIFVVVGLLWACNAAEALHGLNMNEKLRPCSIRKLQLNFIPTIVLRDQDVMLALLLQMIMPARMNRNPWTGSIYGVTRNRRNLEHYISTLLPPLEDVRSVASALLRAGWQHNDQIFVNIASQITRRPVRRTAKAISSAIKLHFRLVKGVLGGEGEFTSPAAKAVRRTIGDLDHLTRENLSMQDAVALVDLTEGMERVGLLFPYLEQVPKLIGHGIPVTSLHLLSFDDLKNKLDINSHLRRTTFLCKALTLQLLSKSGNVLVDAASTPDQLTAAKTGLETRRVASELVSGRDEIQIARYYAGYLWRHQSTEPCLAEHYRLVAGKFVKVDIGQVGVIIDIKRDIHENMQPTVCVLFPGGDPSAPIPIPSCGWATTSEVAACSDQHLEECGWRITDADKWAAECIEGVHVRHKDGQRGVVVRRRRLGIYRNCLAQSDSGANVAVVRWMDGTESGWLPTYTLRRVDKLDIVLDKIRSLREHRLSDVGYLSLLSSNANHFWLCGRPLQEAQQRLALAHLCSSRLSSDSPVRADGDVVQLIGTKNNAAALRVSWTRAARGYETAILPNQTTRITKLSDPILTSRRVYQQHTTMQYVGNDEYWSGPGYWVEEDEPEDWKYERERKARRIVKAEYETDGNPCSQEDLLCLRADIPICKSVACGGGVAMQRGYSYAEFRVVTMSDMIIVGVGRPEFDVNMCLFPGVHVSRSDYDHSFDDSYDIPINNLGRGRRSDHLSYEIDEDCIHDIDGELQSLREQMPVRQGFWGFSTLHRLEEEKAFGIEHRFEERDEDKYNRKITLEEGDRIGLLVDSDRGRLSQFVNGEFRSQCVCPANERLCWVASLGNTTSSCLEFTMLHPPREIVAAAETSNDLHSWSWLGAVVRVHPRSTRLGVVTAILGRDELARVRGNHHIQLRAADGSHSVHSTMTLSPCTQEETKAFNEAAASLAWCTEGVVAKHEDSGRVGKIVSNPDKNGEVQLCWADGSISKDAPAVVERWRIKEGQLRSVQDSISKGQPVLDLTQVWHEEGYYSRAYAKPLAEDSHLREISHCLCTETWLNTYDYMYVDEDSFFQVEVREEREQVENGRRHDDYDSYDDGQESDVHCRYNEDIERQFVLDCVREGSAFGGIKVTALCEVTEVEKVAFEQLKKLFSGVNRQVACSARKAMSKVAVKLLKRQGDTAELKGALLSVDQRLQVGHKNLLWTECGLTDQDWELLRLDAVQDAKVAIVKELNTLVGCDGEPHDFDPWED